MKHLLIIGGLIAASCASTHSMNNPWENKTNDLVGYKPNSLNNTNDIWKERSENLCIATLHGNPNFIMPSPCSSQKIQDAISFHNGHVAFMREVAAKNKAEDDAKNVSKK